MHSYPGVFNAPRPFASFSIHGRGLGRDEDVLHDAERSSTIICGVDDTNVVAPAAPRNVVGWLIAEQYPVHPNRRRRIVVDACQVDSCEQRLWLVIEHLPEDRRREVDVVDRQVGVHVADGVWRLGEDDSAADLSADP